MEEGFTAIQASVGIVQAVAANGVDVDDISLIADDQFVQAVPVDIEEPVGGFGGDT